MSAMTTEELEAHVAQLRRGAAGVLADTLTDHALPIAHERDEALAKLAAAEAKMRELQLLLEKALDSSAEGSWMARALDVEREFAALTTPRPMSEAPRDGTEVLLDWPYWSSGLVFGHWGRDRWESDAVLSDGPGPIGWFPLPATSKEGT